MPLMCVGDLLTINFDKTITKNLQLQKFAVPLHRQRKRMAPKRPPDGSDIGSVNEVQINHTRGGSTPPALSNY